MRGRTLFCLFVGGIALSYLCLGVWAVEAVMIAKGDLPYGTGGGWVRVIWWATFAGVFIGGWTALIATIKEDRKRRTDANPPPH